MTAVFVGESPPAGSPPDFEPFDCASGTRLATIMLGLRDRATLLEHVPRANIFDTPVGARGCDTQWSTSEALQRADAFGWCRAPAIGGRTSGEMAVYPDVIVALGRRTAEAFRVPDTICMPAFNWAPPILSRWRRTNGGAVIIYAPHPSGASSTLSDAGVRVDVRAALVPELVLGVETLRPWHFRLDDAAALASVAAAVAPLCPALGAAALLWAASMHNARLARASSPLLGRLDVAETAATPWDEPLRETARCLLRPNGARRLAEAWDPVRAGTTWLGEAARAHHHLNTAQARSDMRATLARYAEAGLA